MQKDGFIQEANAIPAVNIHIHRHTHIYIIYIYINIYYIAHRTRPHVNGFDPRTFPASFDARTRWQGCGPKKPVGGLGRPMAADVAKGCARKNGRKREDSMVENDFAPMDLVKQRTKRTDRLGQAFLGQQMVSHLRSGLSFFDELMSNNPNLLRPCKVFPPWAFHGWWDARR